MGKKINSSRCFWPLFLGGIFVLFLLAASPIASKNANMEADLTWLREDVNRLRNDNALYRRECMALRSDPHYIEVVARKELGMKRSGEITNIQPASPTKSQNRFSLNVSSPPSNASSKILPRIKRLLDHKPIIRSILWVLGWAMTGSAFVFEIPAGGVRKRRIKR